MFNGEYFNADDETYANFLLLHNALCVCAIQSARNL